MKKYAELLTRQRRAQIHTGHSHSRSRGM